MTINNLAFRQEITDDLPPDVELPSQGGGYQPQLPPGTYLLRLPADINAVFDLFDIKNEETGKTDQRCRLVCTNGKGYPLVVVGGPHDGETLSQTISNVPRKRSKKPDAVAVSDMTYLLRESLKSQDPIRTPADWYNAILKYAGRVFRAETGLQGQCREDKVRYIEETVPSAEDASQLVYTGNTIEDPNGTMGCGKRFYTQAFKGIDPETRQPVWQERVTCPGCGASIRGFAQIDRFLPPLAGMEGGV